MTVLYYITRPYAAIVRFKLTSFINNLHQVTYIKMFFRIVFAPIFGILGI